MNRSRLPHLWRGLVVCVGLCASIAVWPVPARTEPTVQPPLPPVVTAPPQPQPEAQPQPPPQAQEQPQPQPQPQAQEQPQPQPQGEAASQPAAPSLSTTESGELTPIVGRHVRDPDGTDVGRLWDVLVDRSGLPRAVVIDYGGMMGIGRRKVAVAWSALQFPVGDVNGTIGLALTKKQMGAIPEYQYGIDGTTLGDSTPVR